MARATTADTRSVTIQLSQLTEHLGCVVCHGLLREAHTIPDCLHSFCKSCIYRHFLVQGSTSCPKCLVQLKPRPITTLISDQKLQDVVDRIFPELKANDVRMEQAFYETHGFKRKDPSAESSRPSSATNGSRKKAALLKPLANGGPRRAVLFTIEVYPSQGRGSSSVGEPLPKLQRPFVHVDGRFKMSDLSKWIRRHVELDEAAEVEVTCMGATVGPELSVQFVHRTIWQLQHQDGKRLVLEYRLLIP